MSEANYQHTLPEAVTFRITVLWAFILLTATDDHFLHALCPLSVLFIITRTESSQLNSCTS